MILRFQTLLPVLIGCALGPLSLPAWSQEEPRELEMAISSGGGD